jgi:hypothetical protein
LEGYVRLVKNIRISKNIEIRHSLLLENKILETYQIWHNPPEDLRMKLKQGEKRRN